MAKRKPQLQLLKKESSAYGGELLNTRKGRLRGRPLATKSTMHLVLRSSQATKEKSFYRFRQPIIDILKKFSSKHGVKIVSYANAGNHLHLQLKLSSRYSYKPFIRAVTAAIAMRVTGRNRWSAGETTEIQGNSQRLTSLTDSQVKNREPKAKLKAKFWDLRPFSRIIESFKAYLTLKDYIYINELEGRGYTRNAARFEVGMDKIKKLRYSG